MNNSPERGRHRAPGRHNPLTELRAIARESAQPAMKGAVVVAAAGGLVASFAGPANAESVSAADTHVAAIAAKAPAVVGPDTASHRASTALASFGFAPATAPLAAKAGAATKPVVIEDVVVKAERVAAAKAKAVADAKAAKQRAEARAAERRAAEKRADERADAAREAASQRERTTTSRSSSRSTLTSSTSTTKSSVNTSTPSASQGSRGSRNWATPGQCTWGALSKWYQSEGYYPTGWTGNALSWGYGARNAGYTVSSTPRSRSIVVMQPGVHGSSSYAGHVGWVTSVSGNSITIVEMNALAGAYAYNTRTLTHQGGMQYIYAP